MATGVSRSRYTIGKTDSKHSKLTKNRCFRCLASFCKICLQYLLYILAAIKCKEKIMEFRYII